MPSSLTENGRIAGGLYLALAITGGFSMLYVPSLVVANDPTATAGALRAAASTVRLAIVSGLLCQLIFVLLGLALYRLFAAVDRVQAAVMLALVVVAAPIGFVNVAHLIAALRLVTEGIYTTRLGPTHVDALAFFHVDLYTQGLLIVELFWGLWLLPLGLLILRSKRVPAIFGVLLIVACAGYLVDFFARLLMASPPEVLVTIAGLTKFGEPAIILWLLIAGVRPSPAATANAA